MAIITDTFESPNYYFQEREKKVAEEIATKPETEIGDSNPEPEGI